jgi:glycine/serine hydroxymethyltransferase
MINDLACVPSIIRLGGDCPTTGGFCVRNSELVGRAIAEAVSRWLPTAAARVRAWVWQVGFVVDKVASGQVFS